MITDDKIAAIKAQLDGYFKEEMELMRNPDKQAELKAQLAALNEEYVREESPGETLEEKYGATQEWVRAWVRLTYGVDRSEQIGFDQQVVVKIRNTDLDDDKLSLAELRSVRLLKLIMDGKGERCEELLEEANAADKREFSEQQSARAASRGKNNLVNNVIRNMVKKNPQITATEVWDKLEQHAENKAHGLELAGECIVAQDGPINAVTRSLIDTRLSRIKKKMKES